MLKFMGSGRRWCSVRILMLLGAVWLGECSLPLLVWILVTFHDFCLFGEAAEDFGVNAC